MTMYAITLRQPWAHAVAHFGKNVENRTRRPPAHLIGQRVAIHAGQTASEMALAPLYWAPHLPHLLPLREFALAHPKDVPNAGRIIATARLVCAVGQCDLAMEQMKLNPWFTGPIGWVLADVRPLAVPVGADPCVVCQARIDDPAGRDGHASNCRGYGEQPIPGKLYPFALSPEVEAAVLQQEASNA